MQALQVTDKGTPARTMQVTNHAHNTLETPLTAPDRAAARAEVASVAPPSLETTQFNPICYGFFSPKNSPSKPPTPFPACLRVCVVPASSGSAPQVHEFLKKNPAVAMRAQGYDTVDTLNKGYDNSCNLSDLRMAGPGGPMKCRVNASASDSSFFDKHSCSLPYDTARGGGAVCMRCFVDTLRRCSLPPSAIETN